MDIPGLPTDNLYKFVALSGLTLAGFCAWLRWKLYESDSSVSTQRSKALILELERQQDIRKRENKLYDEANELDKQIREMSAGIDSVEDRGGTSLFPTELAALKDDRAVMMARRRELAAEITAAKKEYQASDKIVREFEVELQIKVARKVPANVIRDGLLVLVVAGLGTSVVGFREWQRKLQVFQDQTTVDAAREQKAKADLAEVELAKAQRAVRRHRR